MVLIQHYDISSSPTSWPKSGVELFIHNKTSMSRRSEASHSHGSRSHFHFSRSIPSIRPLSPSQNTPYTSRLLPTNLFLPSQRDSLCGCDQYCQNTPRQEVSGHQAISILTKKSTWCACYVTRASFQLPTFSTVLMFLHWTVILCVFHDDESCFYYSYLHLLIGVSISSFFYNWNF